MTAEKPGFATNDDGTTVANAINGYLNLTRRRGAADELAIATAYFNPGGYTLVADELDHVGTTRLLLGAEPDTDLPRPRHLANGGRDPLRAAVETHERDLSADRDLLGFDYQTDQRVRRMIDWLRSGKVKARRLTDRFLHGKAFVVNLGDYDDGVLAGSANFTYAGLSKNLELVVGQYDPHAVKQVRQWYERQWDAADDYLDQLIALYAERYEPHSPWVVYLRMLWERYGQDLIDESRSRHAGLRLTGFQATGVWQATRIMERFGGVVIADGVGLGKSFIGGELMRRVVENRQRVLLVAPAALRDGTWAGFIKDHFLAVECVSYEELSEDLAREERGEPLRNLRYKPDDYALVVIDEAHAYRNPDSQRAQRLRGLMDGTPRKNLVLLTATPVNNSLWDLYYLLSYFLPNDAAFAGMGIPSLREHFKAAAAMAADDLSPEYLFDVLDAVTVRRTRHFVKKFYSNDVVYVGGEPRKIEFPTPHVVKVAYDLRGVVPDFFPRFARALGADPDAHDPGVVADTGPVLSLTRYTPSKYLVDGKAESRELEVAGLLRSGLLKRFESSAEAFARTCMKMADSHDRFLDVLADGWVATAAGMDVWEAAAARGDDDPTVLDDNDDLRPAREYRVDELRAAIEADRDLLRGFAAEVQAKATAEHDPKLAELVNELAAVVSQAGDEASEVGERDRRKVIVFTYYADTADWLETHLGRAIAADPRLSCYSGRVVKVHGQTNNQDSAVKGFAPRYTYPNGEYAAEDDRYDVLIATDVLAEGVNLQQARHIVNYDLPWNPMRVVQRHGRIDRIGSPHPDVFMRCFFPDRDLDILLGLEDLLVRKITTAARTVGVESMVLPDTEQRDVTFGTARDEIERLAAGDAELLETGGETGTAFSGEEYRQELRVGMDDPDTSDKVRALPWGSGSGLTRPGAKPGFVFCVRVGDHPEPLYRYVGMGDPENPMVVEDTLLCLAAAHADPATERVLDDATHRLAYDAWAAARVHVYENWMTLTDLREMQPAVPKVFREAQRLLRGYPPAGVDQALVDEAVEALGAPYGARQQSAVRAAMRDGSPREQADAVYAKVRDLGLRPSPPPEPLPLIEESDVHLVCWLAITPA